MQDAPILSQNVPQLLLYSITSSKMLPLFDIACISLFFDQFGLKKMHICSINELKLLFSPPSWVNKWKELHNSIFIAPAVQINQILKFSNKDLVREKKT